MKEVKLDLKQIFEKEKQPYFRAQYEFTPEELKIPADVGDVNTPVKVDVYITKNPRGEGYKVTYSIKGNIELTCSRCLEVFSKDLGGEHTIVAQNGYEERENLRESDLNTYSLEGDTLNLTQLVREQILLDVPYKPLCHPECKGIEVEEKQNQSPFGELKKLLKK